MIKYRVKTEVKMTFTFRELMIFVQKNLEFIIKNEKSDILIDIIATYFPE